MKKVPNFMLPKALANLKKANELIDVQKSTLNTFKDVRSYLKTNSAVHALRSLHGFSKGITGNAGAKLLNGLKKQRKMSAFAVRSLEGHYFAKAKYHPETIKHLKTILDYDKKALAKLKMTGGKAAEIKELSEKVATYDQAKNRLIDRQINARGNGIVFRRVKGRIIPVRIKK